MICWIYTQLAELFIFLCLPFWKMISLFRKESVEPLPLRGGPLLLVHGYLDAGCVWDVAKARLARKGYAPIYTVSLKAPLSSIEDHARTVERKVQEIRQATKSEEITLIGHSMGGIVCTYYALALAPPHTVRKVITLGSPLHGTKMAYLGIGACAREMRRGSSFLKRLHALFLEKPDLKLYHIGTTKDQIVIPYTSSFLASNPVQQRTFEDLGHASLLLSRRVVEQIHEWL